MVTHLLSDIEYYQLVSVELLQEKDVQSQVKASVDLVRSSTSIEVTSFLKFMNFIYRSNTIVSGLGTNAIIKREFADAYFIEIFYPYQYDGGRAGCYEETNPVGRGLFFPSIDNRYEQKDPELVVDYDEFRDQSTDSNSSETMEGFSGGCFPLDAVLSSTLQCLFNTSCLEILPNYFPGFSRVCVE